MLSEYSRSRSSSYRSSSYRSSSYRSSSKKRLIGVGNVLREYLEKYIHEKQNPYYVLTKANIKLLVLFVLSTIKLNI
jgi:hypothetical protein